VRSILGRSLSYDGAFKNMMRLKTLSMIKKKIGKKHSTVVQIETFVFVVGNLEEKTTTNPLLKIIKLG